MKSEETGGKVEALFPQCSYGVPRFFAVLQERPCRGFKTVLLIAFPSDNCGRHEDAVLIR